MSGRCLLDTNIVIALLAGEKNVLEALGEVTEVFLSNVVLGELYYGAFKSQQPRDNIERIEELAENSVVISCDENVARKYGEIKNTLRAKGRPIPENDIWIAATAMLYDLTLVTRDQHFEEVENLLTQSW
ncbi:MAG: type II toxin-antitoxin system VapC family toxin [Rhodothermales bacterium]